MASRNAIELIDKHTITQCDTEFRLPPTLKQVRGGRETYQFTQQQQLAANNSSSKKQSNQAAINNTDQSESHNHASQPTDPLLTKTKAGEDIISSAPAREANVNMENNVGMADSKKKKRIYHKARKHPTVDRIIRCLQDKRIEDDEINQLQDLQLPMLRKILNVIFISLGVAFLLGVIVVIIYTSIVGIGTMTTLSTSAVNSTG